MTSKAESRQEHKDRLWRLDEEAERLSAEVSRRTGEAWKEYVEHGNYKKQLLHARNAARDLFDRIAAVCDEEDA